MFVLRQLDSYVNPAEFKISSMLDSPLVELDDECENNLETFLKLRHMCIKLFVDHVHVIALISSLFFTVVRSYVFSKT